MINIYLNYRDQMVIDIGFEVINACIYFNWFGKIQLKKKRLTFLLILLNKFTAVIVDVMSWSQNQHFTNNYKYSGENIFRTDNYT